MKEIIDVFRMEEISRVARVSIIIALGQAINNRYGSNLTEVLVYELVKQLDSENSILTNEHYLYCVNKANNHDTKN